MTAAAALEVRDLAKNYGDTAALGGVSLRVEGEIFGLLGANGAGKSTLLKCVLGLVSPTSGEIAVCGLDPRREPEKTKSRVGYLPEDLQLYERLTGWELLQLVAGLKGVECGAQIEDDLRYFGLFERRHELIGEYSHGMRKKTGIIAALVGRPDLLLLDEPLNGLDAESMRNLRLRLETLAHEGVSVVISSHVMGFIERICGRVCVLGRGKIVIEGTPERLRAEARMPDEPFDDVFLRFAVDKG